MKRVIVIGGGAAGLMAAGEAAKAGAYVLILEKMHRPGRKICITGKGRCNITNVAELTDFISHFGKTGPFLRGAFSSLFAPETMDFFKGLGLPLVIERGGRVFPESGSAPDVLRVLFKWVKSAGVKLKSSITVDGLLISDGSVVGVRAGGKEYPADAVILATGGASYPETGSTGDGYRLAESAGHTIVPVRPALVPLETAEYIAERMTGLELRNVGVSIFIDGKKRAQRFGEMGFTKFGVTGPVILALSGAAVDAMGEGKRVSLSIDLKPALDDKKLDARLIRDFKERAGEPLNSLLRGLLPREMVPVSLELTEIPPLRKGSEVTAKERKRFLKWLKDFRLDVTRPRPMEEAIVTAGGVNTREVDPRTMESRIVKGLYIVGEVLDIQADTGGYNLQAAFSTGHLAGRSAAGVV